MTTEEKKPNNPSAFPHNYDHEFEEGMTLRDYFANSAMQGHLASEYNIIGTNQENKEALAKEFYDFADAMLKARTT